MDLLVVDTKKVHSRYVFGFVCFVVVEVSVQVDFQIQLPIQLKTTFKLRCLC